MVVSVNRCYLHCMNIKMIYFRFALLDLGLVEKGEKVDGLKDLDWKGESRVRSRTTLGTRLSIPMRWERRISKILDV